MEFAKRGLGFAAQFDDLGAELAVDRLHRSRGELHGELTVTCSFVKTGHIHRARFNLSSTSARSSLAKVLAARTPKANIDWFDVLEQFCSSVLAAERDGSPIVPVGRLPAQPAQMYRLTPLLPRDKATIIFGAGGTGKSYLACAIAVSVATGRSLLGYQPEPAPVLYLDWETDQFEIDGRVKAVSAGMGLTETPEIHYRSCAGSLDDMTEDVARFVAEESVGLVVIDSVGMAAATAHDGSDANESTIKLFTSLRYFGTTILAIDHVTGADVESGRGSQKPYGSIYKVNLARSVYELRRAREADPDGTLHLGLYHRKVNGGRLQQAIGIAVTHGETAVSFRREEIFDLDLEMGLSISKRLERALRTGPKTDFELADEIGEGVEKVRAKLSHFSGRSPRRLFVKVDGRWSLVADNDRDNGVISEVVA
jgi:hypothetical protein